MGDLPVKTRGREGAARMSRRRRFIDGDPANAETLLASIGVRPTRVVLTQRVCRPVPGEPGTHTTPLANGQSPVFGALPIDMLPACSSTEERLRSHGGPTRVLGTRRCPCVDGQGLGDRFSAADVYHGAQSGRGLRFGVGEPAGFHACAERIVAWPAAKRAWERDAARMPTPAPAG